MRLGLLVLLLISLLCLAGGAHALSVLVCETDCPYPSLAAALSAVSGGDEIVLVGGSLSSETEVSVNITFPLTITAQSEVQVYPAEADTGLAWLTVSSTLYLAGNLTINSAALHIVAGGRVIQQGALTIAPPLGIGVRMQSGSTFLQQGALVIDTPYNQTIGLLSEGEWVQLGSFQANHSAPQYPCVATGNRGCLQPSSAYFMFGGRWTQNGTVQISAGNVAVTMMLSEWIQNAPAQLSVIAAAPADLGSAAVMIVNGVWKQRAALDVVVSQRTGIYLADGGPAYVTANLWQQDAPVKVRVTSPLVSPLTYHPFVGVEFQGTEVLWNQNADLAIYLDTPNTTRAFNCKWQYLWNVQQGKLSISPPAAFSLGTCVRTLPFASNTSSASGNSAASEQPVLRFDTTNAALQIVPKAASELDPNRFVVVEEATVGLGFASISEVADNGTRLQTGQVLFAAWSVLPANSLGASQAFVLKSLVVMDNETSAPASIARQCTVEMEVFLFDQPTNVSIGDLASFTVLPALTKVAIRVSSWPWLPASDNSSRLEVRLAVSPSFTNVTYPPTPPPMDAPTKRQESGLTSLLLIGQRSSDGKRGLTTEVRFVSVVELDGVVQGPGSGVGRVPVEFEADVESSSLVLSFGHFAANMSYDPDLGVLVGPRDRGESGTSDETWVIEVSIAVPLAVVAVVAVIMVGVVVLAVQKRHRWKQLQTRLDAVRKEENL